MKQLKQMRKKKLKVYLEKRYAFFLFYGENNEFT